MYTAINLFEDDTKLLLNIAQLWKPNMRYSETFAHHCTLHMGKLRPDELSKKGQVYKLSIDAIGSNNTCVAARVSNLHDGAHITLLTTKEGKPKDSNLITSWTTLKEIVNVYGWLTENS